MEKFPFSNYLITMLVLFSMKQYNLLPLVKIGRDGRIKGKQNEDLN